MNPVSESSMVGETMVDDRSRAHGVAAAGPRHVEHAAPKASLLGRLFKKMMLLGALACAVIFGLYKKRVEIPALHTAALYAHLDVASAHAEHAKAYVVGQYETHFGKAVEEEAHHEEHRLTVTKPMARDVTITQEYVCQIHSQRHIEIRALDDGYLEAMSIKEGQAVKMGDLMFQIVPVLYKAELAAEVAERDLAKLEMDYTQTLADKQGVSQKEVQLYRAKLAKAQAKVDLAQAKLNFAAVKAPFDGIIDRLEEQQGSLVKEGDKLTTLSDNSVMWVYFNVTEKRYLEYMAEVGRDKQSLEVVLMLANHSKFPNLGKIDPSHNVGAIEANFDNKTGNIAFRADFPNPEGLLRHGQTGTVLINRTVKDAIVIPQRATFENLAKRYVFVVGEDHKVHQREIVIEHELDDIFVIGKGLDVKDQIVLEGIRQVRDGEKVEFEFVAPDKAMLQKNHAE